MVPEFRYRFPDAVESVGKRPYSPTRERMRARIVATAIIARRALSPSSPRAEDGAIPPGCGALTAQRGRSKRAVMPPMNTCAPPARVGWAAPKSRPGRGWSPRSNRRDVGTFPLPLPTCCGQLGKRKPPMAPYASRRAPSVSEVSVLSIATIRILLRSTLPSSAILRAQIHYREAETFVGAARYPKIAIMLSEANRT